MSKPDERCIEVIGEGHYFEEVSNYIVELNLEVRAAREKDGMREIDALKNTCIQKLIQAGIDQSRILDKGGEVWPPLSHGKRIARDAFHKLIIKTPDIERLSQAIGELESILTNLRHSFSVDMQRTVYSDDLGPELKAQKKAFDNARLKADAIARAAGVKPGAVIRIEELEKTRRDPEASGDPQQGNEPNPDWVDKPPPSPFMTDLESMKARTALIPTPRQDIFVKYRVRFGIED